MNTNNQQSTGESGRRRIHPLLGAAAVAVILVCAVATASMLGFLPSVGARGDTPGALTGEQATQADPGAKGVVQGSAASGATAPGKTPVKAPAKDTGPLAAAVPAGEVRQEAACASCGVIETIRQVQVPTGQSTGGDQHNLIGTLAGGVAGGVVGNQFGGGHGKDALTVLGAVGGALAGREVQQNMKGKQTVTRYEILVRMNDGSARTFHADSAQFASGDHVRIVNNQLQAR